jgi:hypothetical protein
MDEALGAAGLNEVNHAIIESSRLELYTLLLDA